MADNFWFSDEQWAAIEPHLPMVHTGAEHKDGRRFPTNTAYTTVFNRYNRWSQRSLDSRRARQQARASLVGSGP